MRKGLKLAFGMVCGIAAAAAFAGPGKAQAPESYNVGALLAMTGSAPYYGEVMSRAIQLAVDEINAGGGMDGVPMKAFIEDHQSGKAKEGVAGMNRLLSLHGVEAVLSSFSPPTLAIAPIADRETVFVINGGGVSANLIKASKYMVHNRQLTSALSVGVRELARERGYKRMAILHWKTDAGDSARDIFSEGWEGDGREVVAAESIVQGAANIDTQVAKIKVARPDFVALGLFQPEVGLAVKRLRELGIDVPIIGVEWTAEDAKIAGRHSEGYEYTNEVFQPGPENSWAQDFYKAYKERYSQEPDFYAANYYEATHLIAELIRRSKAKGGDYWDGARLHEALVENPTFKSVYAPTMTFDLETGLAMKPVALFKVDAAGKGNFVRYLTTK